MVTSAGLFSSRVTRTVSAERWANFARRMMMQR
jgi:hypothetical protein